MLKKDIDRRTFLKMAAGAGLGFFLPGLAGCWWREKSLPYPSELDKYYRELRETGVKLKSAEKISTNSRIPTTIYNFTDYEFDYQGASLIYNFFEGLGPSRTTPVGQPIFVYRLGGKERIFHLRQREEIKKRILIILPEDTPRPSWIPPSLASTPGITVINSRDGEAFSYVQVAKGKEALFKTPQEATTRIVAIETCQQTIATFVFETDSKPVNDPQSLFWAQEIVCNSWGRATALRLLNIPFDQYENEIKSTRGNLSELNLFYSYIPMPKGLYHSLPALGTIIR